MDEAKQAFCRLDPLRFRALRGITHQRSPRGGRLLHVVEDTRMNDLNEPARVDIEQEHRAVHPIGIGKPAISAMRAP
jgi:hypothetical protein